MLPPAPADVLRVSRVSLVEIYSPRRQGAHRELFEKPQIPKSASESHLSGTGLALPPGNRD